MRIVMASHCEPAAAFPRFPRCIRWGAQPKQKTVRRILVTLVAALGLASALSLATASSFA
jgi:hypothetical protein